MTKSLCPFCQTLCGVTVHSFNPSALCEAHRGKTAEEMADLHEVRALYEETRNRYRQVFRRRAVEKERTR